MDISNNIWIDDESILMEDFEELERGEVNEEEVDYYQ